MSGLGRNIAQAVLESGDVAEGLMISPRQRERSLQSALQAVGTLRAA